MLLTFRALRFVNFPTQVVSHYARCFPGCDLTPHVASPAAAIGAAVLLPLLSRHLPASSPDPSPFFWSQLAKSCRPIPITIMNVVRGKKHTMMEYAAVLLQLYPSVVLSSCCIPRLPSSSGGMFRSKRSRDQLKVALPPMVGDSALRWRCHVHSR